MSLTPAQKRAIDFAIADGELEIGGLDGRPIQRRTADGLVEKGLFTRRPVDPIRGIDAYQLVKKGGQQ